MGLSMAVRIDRDNATDDWGHRQPRRRTAGESGAVRRDGAEREVSFGL